MRERRLSRRCRRRTVWEPGSHSHPGEPAHRRVRPRAESIVTLRPEEDPEQAVEEARAVGRRGRALGGLRCASGTRTQSLGQRCTRKHQPGRRIHRNGDGDQHGRSDGDGADGDSHLVTRTDTPIAESAESDAVERIGGAGRQFERVVVDPGRQGRLGGDHHVHAERQRRRNGRCRHAVDYGNQVGTARPLRSYRGFDRSRSISSRRENQSNAVPCGDSSLVRGVSEAYGETRPKIWKGCLKDYDVSLAQK